MLIETEVNGVRGQTESSLMKRRIVHTDSYDEDGVLHDTSTNVEYWLDGECVHRSGNVVIWRSPDEMRPLIGLMGSDKKKEIA